MSLHSLCCVKLWKFHLPKNGGRYDTASRKGLVSTCLSAGSCLNWCSISRAMSLVRTKSYLWNDSNGLSTHHCWFTVTPGETVCVPYPTLREPVRAHTHTRHLYWTHVNMQPPAHVIYLVPSQRHLSGERTHKQHLWESPEPKDERLLMSSDQLTLGFHMLLYWQLMDFCGISQNENFAKLH